MDFKKFLVGLVLILPLLLAGCGTTSPAAQTVERLKAGGYVIFMRHMATDHSKEDTDVKNLERCEAQRNLSEEGREDARFVGEAMRTLAIPVSQILVSPYCRTIESAELVFDSDFTVEDSLMHLKSVEGSDLEITYTASLRQFLATVPESATNLVLVGHEVNHRRVSDALIAEGEMAIYQPDGQGGFNLIGTVKVEDWREIMRAQTTAAP
ncbi:MAG: histidine phosphatase family protein [Ardenticatenales bacterium]|nr:histidine phosphatase family protein [Ardenticatenales bacterium]